MTAVVYVAKRSLIVGHEIGSSYSIDIPCVEVIGGREKRESSEEALGGARETFLYYTKRRFQVTTAPMQPAPFGTLDLVIEFLESVVGGESFTFDAHGRVNAPVQPIVALLTSSTHDHAPFQRLGQGGKNDWYTIAFGLREL